MPYVIELLSSLSYEYTYALAPCLRFMYIYYCTIVHCQCTIILYMCDHLISKCWVSDTSFSKVILNNHTVCGSFFYTLENEINHLFTLCKAI